MGRTEDRGTLSASEEGSPKEQTLSEQLLLTKISPRDSADRQHSVSSSQHPSKAGRLLPLSR